MAQCHDDRARLGGSKTRAWRCSVTEAGGVRWARVQVWGRDGSDTEDWFAAAYADLHQAMSQNAGPPKASRGKPSASGETAGIHDALKGLRPYESLWGGAGGGGGAAGGARLRIGRCAEPGGEDRVLAANRPCLELAAWTPSFAPGAGEAASRTARAAALAETPGVRGPDLSLAILGGGFPLGFVALTERSGLGAWSELGLDLLGRVAAGAFVAGVGWSASMGALNYFEFGVNPAPIFDSRLTIYAGLRGGHRQPRSRDVLLGLGFLPDEDAVGTKTVGVALAFRMLEQIRTAELGRFVVSFEPYLALGVGAVRIVPLRFTIGGSVGSRDRVLGRKGPEPRPWEANAAR
jgi:hypothetical protein